ncbi:MAG: hypothetical protein QXH37_07555, partial [Candidatus Bathyarchaeia archaeon]
ALFAGWTQGSKMTRRYVHFSARDLEETVLEIHGLKPSTKSDGILKATECPRCGRRNSPDAVRCSFCSFIIDRKLAMEAEEKRVERMEEVVRRLEMLEQTVNSLLSGKGGDL